MESESSQTFRGDTPMKGPQPTPEGTGERVFSFGVVGDLSEALDQRKVEMSELLGQIQDNASSVLNLAVQWEEIEELINERTIEVELKEKSVMERLREVEEKERKVLSLENSIAEEKEKEKENYVKESLKQLLAKEKEVDLLNEAIKEKSAELEKKGQIFEEMRWKEKEMVKVLEVKRNEIEAKENKINLLDKAIKEKGKELEKKEEVFEAILKTRSEEMELLSKYLDLKEKRLEKESREFELKKKGFVEGLTQGETSKRSRFKLLAANGSEAGSVILPVPAKRQKPFTIRENRREEEKEHEPKPRTVPESQFHDFTKNIDSFEKGQVWALYDGVDKMPRLYGQINKVVESPLSLEVRWIESRKEEEGVSVVGPVSCGRFKFGTTETQSYLMFSHEMPRAAIQGRYLIKIYPKQGETWAMFRNWSNDVEKHKPPYRYDIVEILSDFNGVDGVRVVYLKKVQGFVSVFERRRAVQNGRVIPPEEMQRFSHRVLSFRLSGDEGERVPVGSFELDPAAVPSSLLQPDQSKPEEATGTAREVKIQDGSRNDHPIIILD